MTVLKPVNNSKNFRYKFYIDGIKYEKTTPHNKLRDAQKFEAAAKREATEQAVIRRIAEGKEPGRASDMALGNALATFQDEWIIRKGFARPDATETSLLRIGNIVGLDTFVTEIDDNKINAYIDSRREMTTNRAAPPSSDTINTELSLFQRFMNFMLKKKKIQIQIIDWKELRLAPSAQRKRVLKIDEELLLLNEAPKERCLMLTFALATGLRKMNFTTLKWSDVDLKERTYTIFQKGGREITRGFDDEVALILVH